MSSIWCDNVLVAYLKFQLWDIQASLAKDKLKTSLPRFLGSYHFGDKDLYPSSGPINLDLRLTGLGYCLGPLHGPTDPEEEKFKALPVALQSLVMRNVMGLVITVTLRYKSFLSFHTARSRHCFPFAPLHITHFCYFFFSNTIPSFSQTLCFPMLPPNFLLNQWLSPNQTSLFILWR